MIRNYDPGLVIVTAGSHTVNGFADGSFVKVERASDTYTKVVGADGQVSRTRSRDRSGRVTITLLQTSTSNDYFANLAQVDEASGAGVVPFMVKDLGGTSQAAAPNAWVVKPAALDDGKEQTAREWILDVDDLTTFVGGALLV